MARKINFPDMVADGEAVGKGDCPKPPHGFRAQTVNGTAQCEGSGWNKDFDYSWPEVPETGVWKGNRTGE